MDRNKFSPKIYIGILLLIFFGVSLLFRITLPYDQVFSGEWIKLTSIDAYLHMRLVDNLVHNFPSLTSFDPYYIYPGGRVMSGMHFFDWLLACIIWVIGLGSPTQHIIDVVGVYFPAILAALTVIPVYFIGKELFNRWVGVLAAALMVVLPGEFMGRSILGFTDHHVAETLFSTVAVLFLIKAIKMAGGRQLTLGHLRYGDWATITKPLVYSLLAGIFLGIYLITWGGALLFVFIITLYLIIQFIIDHLRQKSVDYLGITGVITFLIALIVLLLSPLAKLHAVSLVFAVVIPLLMFSVSRAITYKQMKPAYYPLMLAGIAIVAVGIFYVVNPYLLGQMLAAFRIFTPVGATATTTLEMQPFLSPQGSFSTLVAWGNFTTSFFISPWWIIFIFGFAALCGLIYRAVKEDATKGSLLISLGLCVVMMIIVTLAHPPYEYRPEEIAPIPGFALISFIILIYLFIKQRGKEPHWLLFLLWTLVILLVTLVQRRFAYYFVINVALLSAYLSWQAIWLVGLRRLAARPAATPESARPERARVMAKRRRQASQGVTIYYVNAALAIILVFLLVFFPNIGKAREVATQARFAPSDAWQESLLWMKENTPEPFGEPDAYYQLYEPPPAGENYTYPTSAYGVTSWWDYGYWITRTAHRLPSANPGQSPGPITNVARLFLSREEASALEIMEKMQSSYIIIDYDTCTSKFWAVVTWLGREQDEFIGIYYLPHEGKLVPVQLFYPEYYRSMCVRLYNFDGKAVTDESPMVVSYDEKVDHDGNCYRQVTNAEEFPSYQEALDYIESQGSSNHSIVGINPFVSPIALEAVQNFKLVYSSESGISHPDRGSIPEVKIFESIGE